MWSRVVHDQRAGRESIHAEDPRGVGGADDQRRSVDVAGKLGARETAVDDTAKAVDVADLGGERFSSFSLLNTSLRRSVSGCGRLRSIRCSTALPIEPAPTNATRSRDRSRPRFLEQPLDVQQHRRRRRRMPRGDRRQAGARFGHPLDTAPNSVAEGSRPCSETLRAPIRRASSSASMTSSTSACGSAYSSE